MWKSKVGISFLVVLIYILSSSTAQSNRKVVCYYGTWATYRPGPGKFDVADIDPFVCTHLIYTFFGISTNDIISLDPFLDFEENYGRGNIRKFVELKNQNPDLKLLAAIGGWNFGSPPFSQLAANPQLRREFAQNTLRFLTRHGFDGLDVDWEYPNQRGGRPEDVVNFPLLLKDIYDVLHPRGLLLTVAVGATEESARTSYDIPEVNRFVDFINIMTYDLHGPWNQFTGLHTAMFPGSGDKNLQWNIDACVKYWISEGASRDKLILGMATYGRTFRLQNQNTNGIHASTNGPGTAGQWTREAGFLGYNEICLNNWGSTYDSVRKAVFSSRGSDWVGYDDIGTIAEKAEYVIQNRLGGAMFWSIETDDFRGDCRSGQYPLITTVASIMHGGAVPTRPPTVRPPTTIPPPTSPPTAPPTVPGGSECDFEGFRRDPVRCEVYFQCVHGRLFTFQCPDGLAFDLVLNTCNWRSLVDC